MPHPWSPRSRLPERARFSWHWMTDRCAPTRRPVTSARAPNVKAAANRALIRYRRSISGTRASSIARSGRSGNVPIVISAVMFVRSARALTIVSPRGARVSVASRRMRGSRVHCFGRGDCVAAQPPRRPRNDGEDTEIHRHAPGTGHSLHCATTWPQSCPEIWVDIAQRRRLWVSSHATCGAQTAAATIADT